MGKKRFKIYSTLRSRLNSFIILGITDWSKLKGAIFRVKNAKLFWGDVIKGYIQILLISALSLH